MYYRPVFQRHGQMELCLNSVPRLSFLLHDVFTNTNAPVTVCAFFRSMIHLILFKPGGFHFFLVQASEWPALSLTPVLQSMDASFFARREERSPRAIEPGVALWDCCNAPAHFAGE